MQSNTSISGGSKCEAVYVKRSKPINIPANKAFGETNTPKNTPETPKLGPIIADPEKLPDIKALDIGGLRTIPEEQPKEYRNDKSSELRKIIVTREGFTLNTFDLLSGKWN